MVYWWGNYPRVYNLPERRRIGRHLLLKRLQTLCRFDSEFKVLALRKVKLDMKRIEGEIIRQLNNRGVALEHLRESYWGDKLEELNQHPLVYEIPDIEEERVIEFDIASIIHSGYYPSKNIAVATLERMARSGFYEIRVNNISRQSLGRNSHEKIPSEVWELALKNPALARKQAREYDNNGPKYIEKMLDIDEIEQTVKRILLP